MLTSTLNSTGGHNMAGMVFLFLYTITGSAATTAPTSQATALVAVYNTMGGASWTHSTDWDTTLSPTSTPTTLEDSVCSWYGITCGSQGVLSISLRGNGLAGTFPAEFSSLTTLTTLELNGNSISGTIPDFSTWLPDIQTLTLHDNQMSGWIPATMTSLTKITAFTVSNNTLSGTLPDLSSLTSLDVLAGDVNQLSGTLPDGTFQASLPFSMFANKISGSIPPTLISNLGAVFLHRNRLSGTLSDTDFAQTLAYLTLSDNKISGTLPSLERHVGLKVLVAYNNEFTGSITLPGNNTELSSVYLHNNRLTCEMSTQSAYNGALTESNLILPGNFLSSEEGAFPEWVTMRQVPFLYLAQPWYTNWEYTYAMTVPPGLVLILIMWALKRKQDNDHQDQQLSERIAQLKQDALQLVPDLIEHAQSRHSWDEVAALRAIRNSLLSIETVTVEQLKRHSIATRRFALWARARDFKNSSHISALSFKMEMLELTMSLRRLSKSRRHLRLAIIEADHLSHLLLTAGEDTLAESVKDIIALVEEIQAVIDDDMKQHRVPGLVFSILTHLAKIEPQVMQVGPLMQDIRSVVRRLDSQFQCFLAELDLDARHTQMPVKLLQLFGAVNVAVVTWTAVLFVPLVTAYRTGASYYHDCGQAILWTTVVYLKDSLEERVVAVLYVIAAFLYTLGLLLAFKLPASGKPTKLAVDSAHPRLEGIQAHESLRSDLLQANALGAALGVTEVTTDGLVALRDRTLTHLLQTRLELLAPKTGQLQESQFKDVLPEQEQFVWLLHLAAEEVAAIKQMNATQLAFRDSTLLAESSIYDEAIFRLSPDTEGMPALKLEVLDDDLPALDLDTLEDDPSQINLPGFKMDRDYIADAEGMLGAQLRGVELVNHGDLTNHILGFGSDAEEVACRLDGLSLGNMATEVRAVAQRLLQDPQTEWRVHSLQHLSTSIEMLENWEELRCADVPPSTRETIIGWFQDLSCRLQLAAVSAEKLEAIEQLDKPVGNAGKGLRVSLVVLVWQVFVLVLGIIPACYAAAKSVPNNNTLDLDLDLLQYVAYLAPLMMTGISAVVMPFVARQLVRWVGTERSDYLANQTFVMILLTIGDLLFSLVIPTTVSIVLQQNCFAYWHDLWNSCVDNDTEFDEIADPAGNGMFVFRYLTHDDICGHSYTAGHCARSVTAAMAQLIIQKLILQIFVFRPLGVIWVTPKVRNRAAKIIRSVWKGYQGVTVQIEKEIPPIIADVSAALVFGASVPWIIGLTGIACHARLLAIKYTIRSGVKIKGAPDMQPEMFARLLWPLAPSVVLGFGWQVWTYWDNSFQWMWVVIIGTPAAIAAGYACSLSLLCVPCLRSRVQRYVAELRQLQLYQAMRKLLPKLCPVTGTDSCQIMLYRAWDAWKPHRCVSPNQVPLQLFKLDLSSPQSRGSSNSLTVRTPTEECDQPNAPERRFPFLSTPNGRPVEPQGVFRLG